MGIRMLDDEIVDIMDGSKWFVGDGDDKLEGMGKGGNRCVERVGVSGGDSSKGMERTRGSSGEEERAKSSSGDYGKLRQQTNDVL